VILAIIRTTGSPGLAPNYPDNPEIRITGRLLHYPTYNGNHLVLTLQQTREQ